MILGRNSVLMSASVLLALQNARLLGSNAKRVVLVAILQEQRPWRLHSRPLLLEVVVLQSGILLLAAVHLAVLFALVCFSLLDPMLSLTALGFASRHTVEATFRISASTRAIAPMIQPQTGFISRNSSDELLKMLPPIYLMAAELDPLLDDSVIFAKRLEGLGCDVQFTVVPGVSHGFLNLAVATAETSPTNVACNQCEEWLYTALGQPSRPSSIDKELQESKRELEAHYESCSTASRERFVVSRLSEAAVEGFLASGKAHHARAGENRAADRADSAHHREIASQFGALARRAKNRKDASAGPPEP